MGAVSYGHTKISRQQITDNLLVGWKDESIPNKQRKLAEDSIKYAKQGKPQELFCIISNLLIDTSCNLNTDKILEIGCSTGYYYEILKIIFNSDINYTGVDYSEAMIRDAKKYSPTATFLQADGACLPFENNAFDYVISGSILLHVLNYPEHIKETVRVSKNYVIAHRYIVSRKSGTQLMKKMAYDVPVLEVHFNEQEFIGLFESCGTKLIKSIEYITDLPKDEHHMTYLFKKG